MLRTLLAFTATALLFSLASCGGGTSLPDNSPAPGTADLSGQLVSGGHSVSAAGDALSGVDVSLIDAVTGALLRSGVTDGSGRFSFTAVPSENTILLKVEFDGGVDLDNDGTPDSIELSFPLDLTDRSKCEVRQEINFADSDNDGEDDSVDVDTTVSDDNGRSEEHRKRHCHERGETTEDTNQNDEFDDDDNTFEDSDGNGLPDAGGKEDHNGRFADVRARGNIDEISETSITVGGVTFTITDATRLRNGSNNHATPADFAAGDLVVVRGFTNDDGELIALKIRSQHGNNGVDDEFGHAPGHSGDHDADKPGDDDDDDVNGDDGDDADGGDDVDNGGDDSNGDDDVDDDPGSGDGGDDVGGDDPADGDDPNGGDDPSGGDDPGGDDGDNPEGE